MELLLLAFLILLNGLFAMSEMAIVSSRKARLQQWALENRPGATAALALANDPSRFLATIQIGITVIGVTSGAFGEASFARSLAQWLAGFPALAAQADALALAIVVAVIAFVSLIAGELVPKRLALANPEWIAGLVAPLMVLLARLAFPLVRGLSATTDAVLKLLGLAGRTAPPVGEEEIKVLMEQGAKAGVFEKHEPQIVSRLFRLGELRVTGVMTPWPDIVYLDLEQPLEWNVKRIAASGHSRFPAVRADPRKVEGMVLTKTLLADAVLGKRVDIAASMARPLFVPESLTAMEVVALFRKHRQTAGLIVDEHGELQGLVTINDVVKALAGDIAMVEEAEERDIVRREEGSWLIDGAVTVQRFKEAVGIRIELPEEDLGTYHTLGGFAMLQLARVPRVGDAFTWEAYRIEVVDMDGNRVDKVLVTRLPAPTK
ncbi:MAG: HlyC/CorC family transporter [Betaproteobacteria bacterium]|nr:MAG: HlyC/CorC family transporter [Betaproteobacteria bacterium]